MGTGAVEQPSPVDVLDRLPVDSEFSAAEAAELRNLARTDPGLLVDVLGERGKPKWAAAVRSSLYSTELRDERHRANVEQTARGIQRDAGQVVRRGPNWLLLGGIVAAAVLLTQSDR